MKNWLHKSAAAVFLRYDRAYRRFYRLQSVDDLILINRTIYRGPSRRFADGTLLGPGDPVGVIHFNNEYLSRIQALSGNRSSSKRAAFAFGAALIKSLRALAAHLSQSTQLQDVQVIGGITWFKAHGREIGFEIEALPPGLRQRLLRMHFRVLLRLLFPHLAARENHRLEPHQFWMTRTQLEQLGATNSAYTAQRLTKYEQQTI